MRPAGGMAGIWLRVGACAEESFPGIDPPLTVRREEVEESQRAGKALGISSFWQKMRPLASAATPKESRIFLQALLPARCA